MESHEGLFTVSSALMWAKRESAAISGPTLAKFSLSVFECNPALFSRLSPADQSHSTVSLHLEDFLHILKIYERRLNCLTVTAKLVANKLKT